MAGLNRKITNFTGLRGTGSQGTNPVETIMEIPVDKPDIFRHIFRKCISFSNKINIRERFCKLKGLGNELTAMRPNDIIASINVLSHDTIYIRYRDTFGICSFEPKVIFHCLNTRYAIVL